MKKPPGRLTVIGVGFRLATSPWKRLTLMQMATKLFHTGYESWISVWFPHVENINTFQNGSTHRNYRYEDIVDRLLTCVREGHDVVFAVYGSAARVELRCAPARQGMVE